jgi:hypothetical protein
LTGRTAFNHLHEFVDHAGFIGGDELIGFAALNQQYVFSDAPELISSGAFNYHHRFVDHDGLIDDAGLISVPVFNRSHKFIHRLILLMELCLIIVTSLLILRFY